MATAHPKHKRYPLNQCRLYKLKSPAQLADVLGLARQLLDMLTTNNSNYLRFQQNGRAIQAPKPIMKAVHKRVAGLLGRVQTPEYLHSAIKGRSYVSNACQHNIKVDSVKIDIRKFYPSARAQAVFHFFVDTMECNPEVAGILTRLLTVDGYLPTGGNASAILSFWAYRQLFDSIDELVRSRGCILTVYVDDMTVSGPSATRGLIHEIRYVIGAFRLRAHKTHHFEEGRPRIVTGVALTSMGPRVPNRRQKRIAAEFARLNQAVNDAERLAILDPLISRVFEAAQIEPAWLPRAANLVAERRRLRKTAEGRQPIISGKGVSQSSA